MQNLDLSIPSRVLDSRDVPLAELPALSRATLGAALSRVMPEPRQATPVPVAAFQSAI